MSGNSVITEIRNACPKLETISSVLVQNMLTINCCSQVNHIEIKEKSSTMSPIDT